jgi:hypothetical protein
VTNRQWCYFSARPTITSDGGSEPSGQLVECTRHRCHNRAIIGAGDGLNQRDLFRDQHLAVVRDGPAGDENDLVVLSRLESGGVAVTTMRGSRAASEAVRARVMPTDSRSPQRPVARGINSLPFRSKMSVVSR